MSVFCMKPAGAKGYRCGRGPVPVVVALWAVSALFAGGCEAVGYAANAVAGGDRPKKVKVPAEYRGLENKSVAVLVAADEMTLFEYPKVPAALCEAISRRLSEGVVGVQVVDVGQVARFQAANPYWDTWLYGDLLQRLRVERLVYVDLLRYRTHEPGDPHVWRGDALASVGVVEAEAADPNNFVYATTVQVRYPPGHSEGRVGEDAESIPAMTLATLSLQVVNRFREHEELAP